jgi:hypothetical protein
LVNWQLVTMPFGGVTFADTEGFPYVEAFQTESLPRYEFPALSNRNDINDATVGQFSGQRCNEYGEKIGKTEAAKVTKAVKAAKAEAAKAARAAKAAAKVTRTIRLLRRPPRLKLLPRLPLPLPPPRVERRRKHYPHPRLEISCGYKNQGGPFPGTWLLLQLHRRRDWQSDRLYYKAKFGIGINASGKSSQKVQDEGMRVMGPDWVMSGGSFLVACSTAQRKAASFSARPRRPRRC